MNFWKKCNFIFPYQKLNKTLLPPGDKNKTKIFQKILEIFLWSFKVLTENVNKQKERKKSEESLKNWQEVFQ